jgi:hypothetical protein
MTMRKTPVRIAKAPGMYWLVIAAADGADADQRHADEAGDGRDRREDGDVAGVDRGHVGALCRDHGPSLLGPQQDGLHAFDQ